jgi:hypothetical protein
MLRRRNLLAALALMGALSATASAGIIHTDKTPPPPPPPASASTAQSTGGLIHTDEAEGTTDVTTGLTEIALTLLGSVLAIF